MDYHLFRLINDLSGQYKMLDRIMLWSSEYVTILLAFALFGFFIVGLKKKIYMKTALFTGAALVVSMGIGYVVKGLFYRPRPFIEHDVNLLVLHNTASSFPSNHTLAAFAIALGIAVFHKKVGSLLLLCAGLIGLSRVYLGHHYPLDVFAGVSIALLVVFLLKKSLNKLERGTRRHVTKRVS
ncbi:MULTISPECIES: phosphatase PAP2 family protein [Shouchella]|uniref:Phosphatase PAP2 family protein n=2 Tax=Shouchella TaxID=2893057 RepID=A0ABY7WBW2_9BACI|nr:MULTISPECIES: phosphatase PAP2 family protein [Shouchella]MED4128172.1 phosphatase PAP2 family protein [Shouchella miscanthi]WDF04976.1 phosphatase PAP2 family protein [Shouchella hunanensis]GAF21136.1 bacitracin transport permease protein BcrC [Bacillus sp. JCM 19047]